IEMAKQQKGTARRLKALVSQPGDKASDFLWNVFKQTFTYSASLLGEIADDIVSIDNAMKWGFGWRMGPFEMWDAIGVQKSVERMKEEGLTVPSWVENMLAKGHESFYSETSEGRTYYDGQGTYVLEKVNEKEISLSKIKGEKGVIKKNKGASLIDLDDGVALLEFSSPNNAIGLDVIQMVNDAIPSSKSIKLAPLFFLITPFSPLIFD